MIHKYITLEIKIQNFPRTDVKIPEYHKLMIHTKIRISEIIILYFSSGTSLGNLSSLQKN